MKFVFSLLLFCIEFPSLRALRNKKYCYALAMEGGGPKNAYTAGVLNSIWKYIPQAERSYDIIVGTSYASINAFILSMYPPGKEELAIKDIIAFWKTLENSMIFVAWSWMYIEGLMYQNGLLDSSPFINTMANLAKKYPNKFQRKVSIGLTDINSGTYVTFDETVGLAKFVDYMRAAISTAGFFPPLVRDGKALIDGRTIQSLDLTEAIEECRMYAEDPNIILDVIMIQQVKNFTRDTSNYLGIEMAFRGLELNNYVNTMNVLFDVMTHYPDIQLRYIFYPQWSLPSMFIPVSIDHGYTISMIEQGEQEAKDTIMEGTRGKEEWKNVIKIMSSKVGQK